MTKFTRTKVLTEAEFHYCPGCTHGIAHRLVAETIEELGYEDKAIAVVPVGCAVFAYNFFNLDSQEAAHGRAPAVGTAIKRLLPDRIVFTYQGDGDLASIGAAEIIHAAARGENITTIFINNGIYGMTGGQMAPTTIIGQKSTTTPFGRQSGTSGYPLDMSAIISTIEGAAFVSRVSLHNVKHILEAKKMIRKAFTYQLEGKGFSFVECLSTCPTNWGLSPVDSMNWLADNMIPKYPLGTKKEVAC